MSNLELEINQLFNSNQLKKAEVIRLLSYFQEKIDTYTWIDLSPNNHQHLSSRLVRLKNKFLVYQVPEGLNQATVPENSRLMYKGKLSELESFLDYSIEQLNIERIMANNDNLLICLGNIINWEVMKNPLF